MFSPASVDIYVCEQLHGVNSSWIVTKLGQSVISLATEDEVIKFWKVKVSGEVCTLLSPPAYNWNATKIHLSSVTYVNEPPWNSSNFSLPARARDAKSYNIYT